MPVKFTVEISQNSVAFSEYMNFRIFSHFKMEIDPLQTPLSKCTNAIGQSLNIFTSNIDEGEQLAKEVSVGPEIVMF